MPVSGEDGCFFFCCLVTKARVSCVPCPGGLLSICPMYPPLNHVSSLPLELVLAVCQLRARREFGYCRCLFACLCLFALLCFALFWLPCFALPCSALVRWPCPFFWSVGWISRPGPCCAFISGKARRREPIMLPFWDGWCSLLFSTHPKTRAFGASLRDAVVVTCCSFMERGTSLLVPTFEGPAIGGDVDVSNFHTHFWASYKRADAFNGMANPMFFGTGYPFSFWGLVGRTRISDRRVGIFL